MKPLLTFMKSIILVALIATSLIQISKLWFEDSSDRNFFYSVIPNNQFQKVTSPNDVGNLLEPNQLSAYMVQPNEYRVIRRGANMYQNITDASVEIIKKALNKDHYIGSATISNGMWERQHIMLKLPVILDRPVLESNLNLDKKAVDKIKRTELIVIVPARDSDIELSVYIEDYDTKLYHQYSVNVDEVAQSNQLLTDYFLELSENENASKYVSALNSAKRFYDDNILLPKPSPGLRYHEELILEVPFDESNAVDRESLDEYVKHFFSNADIVNAFDIEGGILFKELSVATVRYDFRGFVHYYHPETESKSQTNLATALTMAQNFIEKDVREVSTEYYLRAFDVSDEQITFYYDIGYNDFPIVMGDTLMDFYELEQAYPIMITIANDQVVEYKRVLRMVDESIPQNKIFESRFEDVLDMFIEEIGKTDVIIEDTYLGYQWSDYNEAIKMHWVIETQDGQRYYYELD